jgi:hypothetical protein
MPGSNNTAGEAVWVPLVCTLLMLISGIFYLIDTATARRDEVTGVIVGLGAKNAVQWVTGG